MFDALRPGAGGFGGAATAPANPFGQLHPAQTPATNPFASATTSNISSNPFAQTQQTTTPVPAASNPFSGQIKPSNPFGANGVAQSSSQPFAQPNSSTIKASPFGSTPFQSSAGSLANAAPAQPTWPGVKPTIGKRKGDVEGQSESKFPRSSPDPQVASNRHTSASRGGHSGRGQHVSTRPQQPRAPTRPATDKDSGLAVKVHAALAKDNLRPPQWPANPGSDGQRKAAENFREAYITYREKARKCLIKANLIDDPDKRRALSDALQFKGICEHMCPDWERITRIVQHDVKREEREDVNGESQANIELMVTRHARSSAGQDAPLPMDVRSPGALKRTLRYMIDELIPEDHFLPARHNFLWDRTRAIRKDFIYQEYAMGHDEMRDYIYCLETIARFHVTALHLLTQSDFAGKDFSAQQENEQLEKTLISLMQAYDDCAKQGIDCDNEADFRSYYIIVMADNPAWMDVVQSFAARFWNDSDSIRTASILVESLKNIWDMQGPLMPPGTSEMALPAISTFFDIVSSPAISYTMACFAEIHFPKIRRLMLKILREAYWRPKTGPVDLTPAVIRRQLRLDSDEEAIEFAKSQGFTFNVANGQMYAVNNARQALSEDKPPRMFSRSIVERKRGNHSLAEVIYTTFYEEPSGAEPVSTEADSLFVDGSQDVQSHIHYQAAERFISTPPVSQPQSPFALPSPAAQDASPKFQTPAMSASESAPGGAQNVFTKPNSTTDGISGTTTSGSVNWLAKSSAPPGPFSLSQTAASPSIPEGKRSAWEPAKPSPAFNLAKSSPLASSFGQQPLSSSSPSIFASKPTEQSSLDKPTSSILSGAASSCATGFVFPNSATVEIPKARPPISASSEPNAERPSSNTFQHLASASQVAPPNVGLGSSKTNAASTTTEASNQDITDSASTSSGFKSSLKPQPAQDNRANRSPAQPQNDPMDLLARWYVCADRGLMEEHLEQWMLESILLKTFEGFEETELERVRKEEDEQSWAEARKFREYSLGVTYFYRWLDKFRKRRAVKRIQLEKQKAKEWNLPENRAKRAAAAQVVKEKSLRASKQLLAQKMSTHMSQHNRVATSPANANRRPRRDSLEDALLVPQNKNLAGSAPPPVSLDTNQLALSDEPLPGEKNLLRFENQRRKKRGLQPLRKYPEAKTYREGSKSAMLKALSSGMGRDTMSMSTNSLRNSTFSSSYRSSLGFNGSRISKPTSRVSDPYWKLKANGLVQMPNGEYLHESLALPMLEEGVRFPGIGDYGISGSSRASVSESPGGSIDIPEFSPPPQPSAQEQRNGIDSFHRRRSRVSMSPAASTSGLHQYHNRIDQPRPHSLSLRRDRKRGYEHLDDDDEEDGLHYVGSASLAANDQDSGREGSVGGGGGGGLHKRARSGGRRVISSAIAGNMGPAAAATATDAQSVASLDDSDFLASIDRLLKDVQDASKVLS